MDVIIINCHVNERGLWVGPGGRGGEEIPYPSNVFEMHTIPLSPATPLTKYPVSNCNGGNPFMPVGWVNLSGTILPLITMLFDLADFMVDVITQLWYYCCPKFN